MAKLPCIWLYLGGCTFRWGRGDLTIDVLLGDTGAVHENDHRIAAIPVDHEWTDVRDLDQRARAWLKAMASKRAFASPRGARGAKPGNGPSA
ncbi:hypothetical protein BJ970_002540 [Saccharopolyspora phatthalungensis]|uniref:Uncharacterized protein n=1 Tax=Saccharopolyspora phatthalungensis TaxID=664693 RepID=A0A840Q3D5_9PSEU|nr:hypothetical protein [Saccharopolyspora phatthalungensis]